jgi:excisionase family DNA binding protein
MTEAEAAEFLGVSPLTLRKWRCLRTHQLPFFKSRNLIRYRLRDLQGFIDQHMIVPVSLESQQVPRRGCNSFATLDAESVEAR